MYQISATLPRENATTARTEPREQGNRSLDTEALELFATPTLLETLLIGYGTAAGALCIIGAFALC